MKGMYYKTMTLEERLTMLDQLEKNEAAAQQFADSFPEEELLDISSDLIGKIQREAQKMPTVLQMEQVRSKAVYSTPQKVRTRQEKQKQLRLYRMRVSIAACATLVLLFSGAFQMGLERINRSEIAWSDQLYTNNVTESLRGFSDKLMRLEMEVNQND